MTVLTTLRAAYEKHRAYTRTRNEIAALPRDVALDLGIFPEDASQIARAAVYG
ncbi:hypothetical protein KUV47_08330 [Vannielia litorea]|uniref:hypothetical protein n=1 Tax=Vannielia TaxID=2813041 RepID=UPI001C958C5B|nr:hypothetical protein [Vannielia litorea]MBY6046869.1 hypothetical protein [Vannielia litorea]MBY6074283.1 hypothetical protein [Vannielia litorea]MBY6153214.1 hypothetical protein [Vannielia litorea]